MKICLLFLCFLCCTYSYSQNLPPIQADRPDQTETPSTVPVKHFQAEFGLMYERTGLTSKHYQLPAVLWKFGITKGMEVRLITEFENNQSAGYKTQGLAPVKIGFKTRLTEEHGIFPAISFLGHIALPDIAAKQLRATYFAPSFRFTMQHDLSPSVSLGYNLGAEWDGESAQPVFIYTLTTGFSLSEKWGCYAEVYGFTPQALRTEHNINGGLTYLVCNNLMVDISAGAGLSENAPDYFIGLGFSIRLKD